MILPEVNAENYDWANEGIYQLEVADPVQGGPGGIANRQATELAKRTRNLYLKKAPVDSPDFTGTPKAPNPVAETNNQQVATTAFVKALIAALLSGNTAFTGNITVPTPAQGANNQQPATTAFVQALISAIDSSPDWAAIENKPIFEGSSALNGTSVDWASFPIRTKTLTASTTLSFTNLVVNKTITLRITGAFALILPASVTQISGEYDGTRINLIQLLCVASAPAEVWCVISQPA